MGFAKGIKEFDRGNSILDMRSDPGQKVNIEEFKKGLETIVSSAVTKCVLFPGKRERDYVVIGGDARVDTPLLIDTAIDIFTRAGIDVISLGYNIPTPAIEILADQYHARAAVAITASHLPAVHNGLKISFLNPGYNYEFTWDKQPRNDGFVINAEHRGIKDYIAFVTKGIDTPQFRAWLSKNPICVDGMHGVTAGLFHRIFADLHGTVVDELHGIPNGNFPGMHAPDPTHPGTLYDLTQSVFDNKAKLGVAFDGDGDRLVVVTSQGKIVDPAVLGLVFAQKCAQEGQTSYVAEKKLGFVQGAIKQMGLELFLADTGRPNIKQAISERHAGGGYEISGHIFDNHGYDDAMRNFLAVLGVCAQDQTSLTQTIDRVSQGLPGFYAPEMRFSYDREAAREILLGLGMHPRATDLELQGEHTTLYLRTSANENKVTAIVYGTKEHVVRKEKDGLLKETPADFREKLNESFEQGVNRKMSFFYQPSW